MEKQDVKTKINHHVFVVVRWNFLRGFVLNLTDVIRASNWNSLNSIVFSKLELELEKQESLNLNVNTISGKLDLVLNLSINVTKIA